MEAGSVRLNLTFKSRLLLLSRIYINKHDLYYPCAFLVSQTQNPWRSSDRRWPAPPSTPVFNCKYWTFYVYIEREAALLCHSSVIEYAQYESYTCRRRLRLTNYQWTFIVSSSKKAV